jgi:hypothetical protein
MFGATAPAPVPRQRLDSEVPGHAGTSGFAAIVRALLSAPYRWFANVVVLQEKRRMEFPAAFGVIAFVSLARAELELITTRTAAFSTSSLLNNFAFYLQSAYLYALLSTRLTGKSLDRVTGVVVLGVFLGVFPPIFDTLLGGVDSGYYRYVTDGFAQWSFALVNPAHYSTGEAITLWLLVVMLALYVLEVTRSVWRGLFALALSYVTVVFIAMGPSSLAAMLGARAAPFGGGTWLSLLTIGQLLIAQAAYLLVRRSVAARLWRRTAHAAPFVALTFLGSSVAELAAPSGLSHGERALFAIVTAILIFDLCLIALVQNDAYDAHKDGSGAAPVTRSDAHFFTVVGVLVVLTVLTVLPGLGIPLALFLCVSTLYSYDFYRSQRFFPANYKSEAIWGWSSFVLGGSAGLSVASTRIVSAGFLFASALVFGGWSVFNVFKDYKDIRADYKVRHPTLYVLALKRGIDLKALHLTLRAALLVALLVPAVALVANGVAAVATGVVSLTAGAFLYVTLGGPPKKRTVLRFLWGIAAYVVALSVIIEVHLRS